MSMNLEQFEKVVKVITETHGIPNLIGEPGTGKTSFVNALSRKWLGTEPIVVLLHNGESADVAGLPFLEEDPSMNTTFMGTALPRWAAKAIEMAKNGPGVMVFFDEISNLPEGHQASALTLLQDRILGEVRFPDNVYFISAMNKAEDSANGHLLSPPLANRLNHITWEFTVSDFITNFRNNFGKPMTEHEKNVRENIALFLSENQNHAYSLPQSEEDRGKAYPTYRTWDNLARQLSHSDMEQEFANVSEVVGVMIESAVGAVPMPIFMAWLKANAIPPIASVIENPKKYDWKDESRFGNDALLALIEGILATISTDAENPSTQEHVDKARIAALTIAEERVNIASKVLYMVTDSGNAKNNKPAPTYTRLFDEKGGYYGGRGMGIGDVFPNIRATLDDRINTMKDMKVDR